LSAEPLAILAGGQRRALEDLLRLDGLDPAEADARLLTGDGSDRLFLRLTAPGWRRIVVLPAPTLARGKEEAAAFWNIGRHLRSRGVEVPELFGFDRETGLVLCEDLGDGLLQEKLQTGQTSEAEALRLYRLALDLLLKMQLSGAVDFDPAWCWDTGRYDRHLMLTRESGYFWQACCLDLLGLAKPDGLDDEFRDLADLAAQLPGEFFLHRDFQSRNLLVQEDRLRVLDFQGGRLGPLGYDLASLLNDPYAALPEQVKIGLFEYYRENLVEARPDLAPGFAEGYQWLALQRNLQILGAFAFLSRMKGKTFFQAFLRPAAENLVRLLMLPGARRFPVLRGLVLELPERIDLVIKS
jgi:aminoglycoside/choline kinase family phosphotransferase